MEKSHNNRQWLLAKRPVGAVKRDDFRLTKSAIPEIGIRDVLVRTLYFGYDATQRMWLTEHGGGYLPCIKIGEAMRTAGIGQVIASNDPAYAPGDIVEGLMSWQDYVVLRADGPMPLRIIPSESAFPLSWNLGVFGVGGLTAYFSVVDSLAVTQGDTVVISGATGATGSLAGFIARLAGASRVIGFAGGSEKCRWIVEHGGYDAAIDYRAGDLDGQITRLCPDGATAFLDSVGGEVLDTMLMHMAPLGRVTITGAISTGYTGPETPPLHNYMAMVPAQLTMKGFLLMYYRDRLADGIAQLARWVEDGRLPVEETVEEGFDQAPDLLPTIFAGKQPGKLILKVADPV